MPLPSILQVLRLLGESDPDNHKHCIRLLRTFEYRHHFCLVFEAMEMNLRDLTKKYGRNRGLDIKAVRCLKWRVCCLKRRVARRVCCLKRRVCCLPTARSQDRIFLPYPEKKTSRGTNPGVDQERNIL